MRLFVHSGGSILDWGRRRATREHGGTRWPGQHRAAPAETVASHERLAALAKELNIYVIFGLVERDADDPEVLYNAAAVVGPEGVQGTYRKLHLGSLPWVTEGV